MKIRKYFCRKCGQLRFTFLETTKRCDNCGSVKIVTKGLGELNKKELKEKYSL